MSALFHTNKNKKIFCFLFIILISQQIPEINATPTSVTPNDKDNSNLKVDEEFLLETIFQEEEHPSNPFTNITDENYYPTSWLPISSKKPRPPSIDIIESSDQGLILNYTLYGMYHTTKNNGSSLFDQISIPDTGYLNEIGKPQIPVIREYIEIPNGVTVSVEILGATQYNQSGYRIWPTQYPIPELPEKTRVKPGVST